MAELISVPFKKSSDVDIVKPLKNLIHSTYNTGESNEDYSDAINELSRLRTNAIWKVFEKSSLDLLYSYYDQLAALETKVPPQEVQIPFKWKDAFDKGSLFGGRMSLTISSLAYEKMCILFNIAAMQSSVAAQQPLDTEDSLKLAAKLFQQSSGIFQYLKANIMMAVHQETTPDLNPETLHALSQLMLAQAQEVIAYKCIKDEMKDSMVAKVCSQCEELYTDTLRALQKDSVKGLWDREWIPLVQAKLSAFRGLTHYFQAQVCRANKAVGEEIARLQLATQQLSAGGAGGAGSAGGAGAGGPLAEAAAKAARQLAAAVRDNDFIYHERIPEPRALEPVPRAPVAKPTPLPDRFTDPPKDLFAALVPLAVRSALHASAARRSDMVGAEINKLRDATHLLNSILASLNLPACIEAAEAEGAGGALPPSTRAAAAAVREAGGLPALQRLMADLPDLLQRNREILTEAERMLREEEQADAALRAQFGARWARTPSAQLTEAFKANAAKYAQIIDNAVRADAIVQQKFNQHKESIELLSRSDGEISEGVPDADAGAAAAADRCDRRALADLRALMREQGLAGVVKETMKPNSAPRMHVVRRPLCQEKGKQFKILPLPDDLVEQLKAERDAIEAELKEATVDLRAQFLAALAADGALDEPALSAAALGAALAPLQRRAHATLATQESLAERLREAHARLDASRGPASGRERALSRLAAAADAYRDLTANLQEGVKFYNDLTQLLVAFQNKVSDFCFARKTEKDELLKDLTQAASRPAPAPPAPAPRSADAEPAIVKKEAPPRPPPPAVSAASAPGPSALPYPTQPQGMPLPYGAATAPYPVYAPMPALYNPYATLPYPSQARFQVPYQPYQHPAPPAHYPAPPPPGYQPYPPHQ